MNRKQQLRAIFKLMAIIAVVAVAYPFLSSFTLGPEQENDAWVSCDVSTLGEGRIMRCGYATIYKRTKQDFASINKYEALLADPASADSHQPDEAQNPWRSQNPAYFIYMAWAPMNGCAVNRITESPSHLSHAAEYSALVALPYFTEPCEARTWDMSGRLYYRESPLPTRNLDVPRVKWQSGTLVHVRQNLK